MNETKYKELLIAAQRKSFLEFLLQNNIVNERNHKIEFKDHYFLFDVCDDWTPVQAVRKAAQIGWSTLIILKALYAANYRGYNVIYTLPTQSDVDLFVSEKVNSMIRSNPVLSAMVPDKDTIIQKKVGERFIYYRGTITEKEALMLSSDLNVHDEVDRSDLKTVEQYESRLGFSKYKGKWHFSNPSFPNVGVDVYYNASDQKHWFIKCPHCNHLQYLSFPENISFEDKCFICSKCKRVLSDADRRKGQWVKKWRGREVSGYWISQLMCPWISASEIIKQYEEKEPDFFYNFVLGLPYQSASITVDADIIYKNIVEKESSKTNVIIGVDVGKFKNVVVGTPSGIFKVYKTSDWDDIERDLVLYDAIMVVDGMPDITKPRELMNKYKGRVFINFYKEKSFKQKPFEFKKDEQYGVIQSDRNRVIEKALDDHIKGKIKYHLRADQLDEYVDNFTCNYKVVTEDRRGNPVVRWEHSRADHYFHAYIYYSIGRAKMLSGEGVTMRDSAYQFRGKESFYVGKDNQIPAVDISEHIGKPKKDWRYN